MNEIKHMLIEPLYKKMYPRGCVRRGPLKIETIRIGGMMTMCKDCIHYEVCNDIDITVKGVEVSCKYQKDKSRFVELPCKVGDTVYTNMSMKGWYMRKKDKPYKGRVVFIGINGEDNFMDVELEEGCMIQFYFSQINHDVFLSREAAEKALKEGV